MRPLLVNGMLTFMKYVEEAYESTTIIDIAYVTDAHFVECNIVTEAFRVRFVKCIAKSKLVKLRSVELVVPHNICWKRSK